MTESLNADALLEKSFYSCRVPTSPENSRRSTMKKRITATPVTEYTERRELTDSRLHFGFAGDCLGATTELPAAKETT
jgi:hypothetical protein